MNLNDFYVLVDTKNKEVIDKFQKLPRNWKNIAGLRGLSNQELENLEWAGHYNLGWINLTSPKMVEFKSSIENLELNKNTLKLLVSEQRKEYQNNPIEYKGAKIKTDIKTRYSLHLKIVSKSDQINFKCINGYFTFTKEEIIEILNLIESRIQEYFDNEMKIYQKIDQCKSIIDLSKLNI